MSASHIFLGLSCAVVASACQLAGEINMVISDIKKDQCAVFVIVLASCLEKDSKSLLLRGCFLDVFDADSYKKYRYRSVVLLFFDGNVQC